MKRSRGFVPIFAACISISVMQIFFCDIGFAANSSSDWLRYRELQKKRVEIIAAQIVSKMPNDLGEKLQKIKYYVSLDDQINAYAAVGGKVVIYKGLLAMIENRDELAFVIAHELGHHGLRHYAKNLLATIFGIGLEVGAQALLNQRYSQYMSYASPVMHQPLSSMVANAFSQKHENDADRFGTENMNAAGFQSKVGVEILKKMFEAKGGLELSAMLGYLGSHPPTMERYKDVLNSASLDVAPPTIFISSELDQIEKDLATIEIDKGIEVQRQQTRAWMRDKSVHQKDKKSSSPAAGFPKWLKKLDSSKRDQLPEAYKDLGVLAMGLTQESVNFTFGKMGVIEAERYQFSLGEINWFMRLDHQGWKRILPTSLKTKDYRACWYLPDGTLYAEQFFKMSNFKLYTISTGIKFDADLKPLMIGDWRVMIFEDDQLVDVREFKVVNA